MQKLYCQCGYRVYPNNRFCLNCGAGLGFDCLGSRMISFSPNVTGIVEGSDGRSYELCRNRSEHDACNGLVEAGSGAPAPLRR